MVQAGWVRPIRCREASQRGNTQRRPHQMDDTNLGHRGETYRSPVSGSPVDLIADCWACGTPASLDPSWLPVRLHRCPACGLLFAADRPAEELRSLYDAEYFEDYPGGEEAYEDDPAQRRYESAQRIAFVRRFRPHGRLLEIGAAAGYFVEAALEAGYEPTGVEPAAELAERARERIGAPVLVGFVEDVDLEPATFDAACAWHVVEHLSDPHEVLVRVRDVLRPGGHLLIEVPNIDSVQSVRLGRRWTKLDHAHHVAHYSPASLHALLQRAGYDVVLIETFPMRRYLRPGRALRPRELAAALMETARLRSHPLRPHPTKHELLRAVAVAPDEARGTSLRSAA